MPALDIVRRHFGESVANDNHSLEIFCQAGTTVWYGERDRLLQLEAASKAEAIYLDPLAITLNLNTLMFSGGTLPATIKASMQWAQASFKSLASL